MIILLDEEIYNKYNNILILNLLLQGTFKCICSNKPFCHFLGLVSEQKNER